MRRLNVRINVEDAQLVRDLRDRGVSIPELVRNALRAEARRARTAANRDEQLVDEMMTLYPTPARAQRGPRVDSTDRRAVRRRIRNKRRSHR